MVIPAVACLMLSAEAALGAGPPPVKVPEALAKILDILTNPNVMAVKADLTISKSRLGWPWLARIHGVSENGRITRKEFLGLPREFAALDRDGDGVLHAGDFDWSDDAPFVRQQAAADALFRRLNASGDGHLSKEEWEAAFRRMSGKKGHLTPDDLRTMLFPPGTGRPPGFKPPTRFTRLMGLLSGELGSIQEGPDPGEDAPDFTLSTPDGKQTVKLSSFRGKRPVALIFGNFT
jgi:hypothetical protein